MSCAEGTAVCADHKLRVQAVESDVQRVENIATSEVLTRSSGDGGGRAGEDILLGFDDPATGGARCVWETDTVDLCEGAEAILLATSRG